MLQHQKTCQSKWGPHISDEALIPAAAMRAHYMGGCSEMHVWRLLNDPKRQELGFPRPISINGRNYWRVGEIRLWLRNQEAKSRQQGLAVAPDTRVARSVRSPLTSRAPARR
jgi:predicted DNA-binding transcriptional regulator AlpA